MEGGDDGLDNSQDFGTQPMTQPFEIDDSQLGDESLEGSQEDEWEKPQVC